MTEEARVLPRDGNRESRALLKQNLALEIRKEILLGKIVPGEKIIEGRWARHFGVAQVSIREAINILTTEGFVTKGHGRSARVLKLKESDIINIYQVRGVLEGLAARIIIERTTRLRWWIVFRFFIFVSLSSRATLFSMRVASASLYPCLHSPGCGSRPRTWTPLLGYHKFRTTSEYLTL